MSDQPSKILLDELFLAGDERFLSEFCRFKSPHLLSSFVDKWIKDPRPWARQQILEYSKTPFSSLGHEVVVKRLFKHFETEGDHQVLAHFMVAFDRLVRRRRVKAYHYDWKSRQSWQTETLYAKPNQLIDSPWQSHPDENRLYSHRTRNYLRRRVWRHFRHLSYRDPVAYINGITAGLLLYQDDYFAAGENILDNWSLMHACYFHSPAVYFNVSHTNLAPGRALGDLSAKPYQLDAWKTEAGAEALIRLIGNANSSLVRLWAMELIKAEIPEAIYKIEIHRLLEMLSHPDPRVQEFAADLFEHHASLSSLPVATWLELLNDANPSVLSLVCQAMQKHVSADRLESSQIIDITLSRPVPVSRMGFELLKQRHAAKAYNSQEASRLAQIRCESTAEQITDWFFATFATREGYQQDVVIEFFDSFKRLVRKSALNWLQSPDSPGYNDPALWAKLIESPFDDVKIRLVECLQHRLESSSLDPNDLSQLWASVILGVQRGGRTKLKAVEQVAGAIDKDHSQSKDLLPVLAVAVRSIRNPEQRRAIAEVTKLAVENEHLRSEINRAIPELHWPDLEAVGGPG